MKKSSKKTIPSEQEIAQNLYIECCEKLDQAQEAIGEMLKLGHGLDKSPIWLISEAIALIQNYDDLSEEAKQQFMELSDKIASGELTPEEAVAKSYEIVPVFGVEVEEEIPQLKQNNTKKKQLLN